jgi:hypothetical protein
MEPMARKSGNMTSYFLFVILKFGFIFVLIWRFKVGK